MLNIPHSVDLRVEKKFDFQEDTEESKAAKELMTVFEDLKKRVESGEKLRADGGDDSDADDKSSVVSGIVENRDRLEVVLICELLYRFP